MKVTLIEPYVSEASLKSYAEKTEPVHLLGMYNLISEYGVEVEIIDAYSRQMPAHELADRVIEDGTTHVGFTAYDYAPCLSYVGDIVDELRGRMTTFLGGTGPTHTPKRMVQTIKPDWIVRGDGEHALLELVRANFDPQALDVGRLDGTWVVDATPIDLDEIPFARPYSLEFYGYEASPRVQKGCVGKCVFCLGAYQNRFSYLSQDRAMELFRYLVNERKAEIISPSGPDFTAVPRKANDLIRAMLQAALPIRAFRPGVRLDTLSAAISLDREIWQELGASTRVSFESSIESFSYPRLKRLGKNVTEEFMAGVFQHIAEIIETCHCTIVLGRIALDPTISIDEFILDCNAYIRLLEVFAEQVTIGGMLMNQFVPLWGTPSMADGESGNPWATPDHLLDPAMAELKRSLLDHPKFRRWCYLAEQVTDFRERNTVFREILRVAAERAEALKRRQVAGVFL